MENKKWNLEENEYGMDFDVWINAIFGAVGLIGMFGLVVFILAGFQG